MDVEAVTQGMSEIRVVQTRAAAAAGAAAAANSAAVPRASGSGDARWRKRKNPRTPAKTGVSDSTGLC